MAAAAEREEPVEAVIVVAAKEDNSVYMYDLRNGTLQSTYTASSSDLGGVAIVGSEYFVASQVNKALVHFYSWRKEQPLYKTPLKERAGPLASTNDANYICMGTGSGTLYCWEVATGTLLRVWEGHYNKITCVSFTKDDAYLVTGGDDGVINVWSLASILDADEKVLRVKTSFTDHSLGISAIHVGFGGCNSRVYSVSLDRTCRVWDLVQQRSIASVVFPAALTSVVVDAGETALYVGGADGVVYQTDLVSLNAGADTSASFVSRTSAEMAARQKKTFVGHTKAISTLALSMDGALLVSGAADGACNIWDSFSRQVVRSIANIKGAVTSISVIINPVELLTVNAGDSRKTYEPIQPFEKYSSDAVDRPSLPARLQQVDPTDNDFFITRSSQTLNPYAIESNLSNYNNNIIEKLQSNQHKEEMNKLQKEIEELKKVNSTLVERLMTSTGKNKGAPVTSEKEEPKNYTKKQKLTKLR
eukprot:gene7736-9066_t